MESLFSIQPYNSTTYADQLAVLVGMFQDRLIGETADHFLDRLYSAASSKRDHTLQGVVNNIASQLGLTTQSGIVITTSNPATVVTVSAGVISFVTGSNSLYISTVIISPDDVWVWRNLSDIVSDINTLSSGSITATLQIPDGLAIQLLPQSSAGCSIAEQVIGINSQLAYSGINVSSVVFNNTVPPYSLTAGGNLVFTSNPPAGTTISYIYNLSPFFLTCSEVGIINLMDPSLQTTALCPDGTMVYQLREFNQAILAKDNCYWG